jgi:hypothetical protein
VSLRSWTPLQRHILVCVPHAPRPAITGSIVFCVAMLKLCIVSDLYRMELSQSVDGKHQKATSLVYLESTPQLLRSSVCSIEGLV